MYHRARCGIHQFVQGGAQQSPAVPRNDAGRHNCRHIVGRLVAFASNESDADANGRGERRDRVAAMMPGIGLYRRALDRKVFAPNKTEQGLFDEHRPQQRRQSKRRRRMMRRGDLANGFDADAAGGEQQQGGDDSRRDRFSFAVTIRMLPICRGRGDHQAAPNHDGTENVRQRFHCVGHEGIRVAEEAGGQFRHRQHRINCQTDKGGAQTALEPFIRHARIVSGGQKSCK